MDARSVNKRYAFQKSFKYAGKLASRLHFFQESEIANRLLFFKNLNCKYRLSLTYERCHIRTMNDSNNALSLSCHHTKAYLCPNMPTFKALFAMKQIRDKAFKWNAFCCLLIETCAVNIVHLYYIRTRNTRKKILKSRNHIPFSEWCTQPET